MRARSLPHFLGLVPNFAQAQANKNKTATQLQGQDSSAAKAQASEGNLRGHNGGQDQPNVGNAGVASIQADLVQAAGGAMNSKQLAQAHKFKALADCMWERFELIRRCVRLRAVAGAVCSCALIA